MPDNFLHDAELRRGLNVLVLKVVDRTHGSGFCLAVSDRENRPMTDLVIRTDDPAREAEKRDNLARTPDAFDNGAYALFSFAEAISLAGKNTLRVTVGSEKRAARRRRPQRRYPCCRPTCSSRAAARRSGPRDGR